MLARGDVGSLGVTHPATTMQRSGTRAFVNLNPYSFAYAVGHCAGLPSPNVGPTNDTIVARSIRHGKILEEHVDAQLFGRLALVVHDRFGSSAADAGSHKQATSEKVGLTGLARHLERHRSRNLFPIGNAQNGSRYTERREWNRLWQAVGDERGVWAWISVSDLVLVFEATKLVDGEVTD